MRKKLLGGISKTDDRKKQLKNQVGSGDEELEVNFGIGFGEDIGTKLIQQKQEKKEKAKMNDFQKWQEKKKDRKRLKKIAAKNKSELAKAQGKMSAKEVEQQSKEERRKKAELELLLGDTDTKEVDRKTSFDERFNVKDNDFAVDPTHKEFRKVVQGHNKIAKRPKKY